MATYIGRAFLDFDFLPKELKDIGYKPIYDFFTENNIDEATKILDKYTFFADTIIHVLLERYWGKMLFLQLSDTKGFTLRHIPTKTKELTTIFKKYITQAYIQNINEFEAIQKICNVALWIWIQTFEFSKKEELNFQTKNSIKKVIALIQAFIDYIRKHNCRGDIDQIFLYTTMQDTAYIIIASVMLINKKMQNLVSENFLKEIVDLFQIKENISTFNDIMRLIFLQSLTWKNWEYMNQYYTLASIRTQLYSCWCDEYTTLDAQKYKFQDELGFIESNNRLNAIANFSLCDLFSKYGSGVSSYYFQMACNFSDNHKLTKIQVEYAFMCLVAFWQHNIKLESALDLILNKDVSKNDILFYLVAP